MTERLIKEEDIVDRLEDFIDDYDDTKKFILELCEKYEEAIAALAERNEELLKNMEAREVLKQQMSDLIESHAGRLYVCALTEEALELIFEEMAAKHVSDKVT